VAAVNTELPERCVIDGAIVVPDAKSRPLDFETLQLRIHTSASRVELLSAQTPARDTRSTAQPGMDFGDQTGVYCRERRQKPGTQGRQQRSRVQLAGVRPQPSNLLSKPLAKPQFNTAF
jgi:hypothetical protein